MSMSVFIKSSQKSIEDAPQGLGVTFLEKILAGINLDEASANMGRKRGVATLLKVWLLEVVRCFNHRLEIAYQDIKSFK